MRLRNLSHCSMLKLEDFKCESTSTEPRARRAGETRPTVGLLLFPGDREKLPGDEKMPPSGKVNSPVMFIVFFKPKFVTCSLRRRPEYNRQNALI